MNSRAKGKVGELEWRDVLRSLGCTDARRGQQFSGNPEAPDVVGGWAGTHVEVKRVEKLSIHVAMAQACEDCGAATPYVAHRKNGKPWLVTVQAVDLIEFCKKVLGVP